MDYFAHLAVDGAEQVEGLTEVLTSPAGVGAPPLGARVKSVHVGLSTRRGRDKARKLAEFLKAIPKVRRIVLEIGQDGLVRKGLVGVVVAEALATLEHVTDFVVGLPPGAKPTTQSIPGQHLAL